MSAAFTPPSAQATSGRAHASKACALLLVPGSTPLKAKARPVLISVWSTTVSSPRSAHARLGRPPCARLAAASMYGSCSTPLRSASSLCSLAKSGRLRT